MIKRTFALLIGCLAFACLLRAQDRSSVFAILHFQLNQKYLFGDDLRSYQIAIINSTDPLSVQPSYQVSKEDPKKLSTVLRPKIVESDPNGLITITLIVGNTYTLELQCNDLHSMSGPKQGRQLFDYTLTASNPMEMTIRIPEDLPVKLDRFTYDQSRGLEDDVCVRSKSLLDPMGFGEPFSYGHPALIEYSRCPSERIMRLPQRLLFAKGIKSIAVFPDTPYDQFQEPLMLGLIINDTGTDLVMDRAMITLQAQDEHGEWQPIEGPDSIVEDEVHAPIVFPAHSCRNFPIRRYAGTFKTHLRVLFQGSSAKEPLLTSEPFEGSIFPSQIKQAKKAWSETRHW